VGCLLPLVFMLAEALALGAIARLVGWPTLVLALVLKSVLAFRLLRWLGRRNERRVERRMAAGGVPLEDLHAGTGGMAGAILLALPAPICSIFGLLLLLPPTRALIGRAFRARLEKQFVQRGWMTFGGFSAPSPGAYRSAGAGDDGVIDVEAEVVEPPADDDKLLPPKA
jgi:UPF0716 protein FxsA